MPVVAGRRDGPRDRRADRFAGHRGPRSVRAASRDRCSSRRRHARCRLRQAEPGADRAARHAGGRRARLCGHVTARRRADLSAHRAHDPAARRAAGTGRLARRSAASAVPSACPRPMSTARLSGRATIATRRSGRGPTRSQPRSSAHWRPVVCAATSTASPPPTSGSPARSTPGERRSTAGSRTRCATRARSTSRCSTTPMSSGDRASWRRWPAACATRATTPGSCACSADSRCASGRPPGSSATSSSSTPASTAGASTSSTEGPAQ